MIDSKTSGLLLLGGATILAFSSGAIGKPNEEAKPITNSSGGGSQLLLVPYDNSGATSQDFLTSDGGGYANVGTGEASSDASKKQMEEMKTQYDAYQSNLLNTVTSSETFSGGTNLTKKETTLGGDTTYYTQSGSSWTEDKSGNVLRSSPSTQTATKKDSVKSGSSWSVQPAEPKTIGSTLKYVFSAPNRAISRWFF